MLSVISAQKASVAQFGAGCAVAGSTLGPTSATGLPSASRITGRPLGLVCVAGLGAAGRGGKAVGACDLPAASSVTIFQTPFSLRQIAT